MIHLTTVVLVLVFISTTVEEVQADVYLHNPGGANDRNCETDENRRNVRFGNEKLSIRLKGMCCSQLEQVRLQC